MKKKLLILGGAAAHCQVVERAREMGIYTIVTDYLPVADAPAKQIADESLQINITDIDALCNYVRENNVDGVMSLCLDPCTVPAYEVASRCGLRALGTREQIMTMSDKALFKSACLKYGLPTLEPHTLEDVQSGKVEFPVVVKPAVGRGSRGVTICHSADAVTAAISRISADASTNGFIIEDYAEPESCPFCLIEFIVIKGTPYLVYFADVYNVGKEHNLEFYYSCHVCPSASLDTFLKNDLETYKSFIKSLGVETGQMMFQSFLKNGRFRPVDMGFRFNGGAMSQIRKDAFGLDLIEPLISYSVGEEMKASPAIEKGMEMWGDRVDIVKFILLKPGTIGSITGFDELRRHPSVYNVMERCRPGSVIPASGDARQDGSHIHFVIKKDKAELRKVLDFIDSTLVIKNTEGEDMIIHIDDYNSLSKGF